MTVFSILGVTLGVAALIIVLSVMGGFEQDLKGKMLRGQPHLEILAENPILGFSLNDVPLDQLKTAIRDGHGFSPFTQGDVVIKQGKHLAAVNLVGVDTKFDNSMWAFHETVVDGDLESINENHRPLLSLEENRSSFPGIMLGEGVAGQLGADLGDEVTILSPQAASGAVLFSGGTITRTYVVTAIFRSRIFTYDSKWAVVRLEEGRKFMPDYDPYLDIENFVTGIAVNADDPYDVDGIVSRLKAQFGQLNFRTWKDANSALLFALQLEKYTMGAILMLIVLVAVFSISGTMMMTVFHKKTQVCLMRSLGMTQKDIARLYMFQGGTIGFLGILLGLALGLGVCFILHESRYIDMPANLNSIRGLPVKFLPFEYAVICIMAFMLTVLGALYPALTASRQNPSSGLRYS
ncbi:lipoprotein-releasing system permease protein [Pseudobacteriovorax antillogorgiicola]|uniref:Lipoprotein-releasing system permease protein n=2 Tax=Pseudobacteriovorax antillogorgiicola TaxID=1513793 RepID=A0A1Y6BAJ3_9BACT|nr:lipoprotein-releasing system permease protein [Pseudobacteriovorax antillogorgiicola]SME99620.1 lipoprotein-releasing system permease protein [Pseudobacteriovorax antillogorgiicola]